MVFVPHPILNRTTAEIDGIADAYVDEILARLTGQAPLPAASAA